MSQKTSAIRVRTRYDTVDDFIVGYSSFFDPRGVFIRTRRLQEVGTRLRFELQLSEGQSVFRGEGVIDEVREPPLSATGIHLRITKLDQTSKSLFERINAERRTRGRTSGQYAVPSGSQFAVYSDTAVRSESAVVMGGAAAPNTQPTRPPASAQQLEPPPPPPGRTSIEDGREDFAGELSGSLLDEIADGIESTFDSLLVGGLSDQPATPDLGGFFGQPSDLVKAPPKAASKPTSHRASWDELDRVDHGAPAHEEFESEPDFAESLGDIDAIPSTQAAAASDEAEYQPWAPTPSQTKRPAEVAERLGVGHEAATDSLLEPGPTVQEADEFGVRTEVDIEDVLGPEPSPEAADGHVLGTERAIDDVLGPEPSLEESDQYVISNEAAADAILGEEPSPAEADKYVVGGEAAIESIIGPDTEEEGADDELGLGDMALAAASQFEEEGIVEEPDVSESAAAIIDEIAAAAEIETVEKAPAEPKPAPEVEEELPLLERAHSASVHNVFVREETGPNLNGLLSDLLDKGDAIHPTSEFAAMEMSDAEAGDDEVDPLDVLLSKDEDDEGAKKKKGFFKRIFGKK